MAGDPRAAMWCGVALAAAACLPAQVLPSRVAIPNPLAITFDDLYRAERSCELAVRQMRFALTVDPSTGAEEWLGFSETLDLSPPPAGQSEPRFALHLLDTIGGDDATQRRRAALHARHAEFLQRYGSFRVLDPRIADRNYTIHYLGASYYLGRPVFCVTVLPRDPSRNAWILELDIETGYALSRSHFTPAGRLIGMIAVVSFATKDAALAVRQARTSPAQWWSPGNVLEFDDAVAAANSMRLRPPVTAIPLAPPGHVLHRTTVATDPLTGDQTLVMAFTDGISSAFYLQTPGAPAPNIPALVHAGDRPAVGVFEFHDAASRQLMFHVGQTMHIVVGSEHDRLLDRFAERIVADVAN